MSRVEPEPRPVPRDPKHRRQHFAEFQAAQREALHVEVKAPKASEAQADPLQVFADRLMAHAQARNRRGLAFQVTLKAFGMLLDCFWLDLEGFSGRNRWKMLRNRFRMSWNNRTAGPNSSSMVFRCSAGRREAETQCLEDETPFETWRFRVISSNSAV